MANLKSYNGVDVFNAIRNSNPILQSRYPEATAETLKQIGKNLSRDNVDVKNAYLNGLMTLVSAVFVKSNNISNPLSELIKGGEYYAWGDLIENIKVHVAKAVDPKYLVSNLGTGKTIDPFVQNQPKTVTEFFKSNLPLQYLVTISEWQLQRAFESAQGMGALVSAILESIQNGIAIDLYQAGKDIMNSYINDSTHTLAPGQVMSVADVVDETTGKAFILAVKNVINAMQFPSKAFNPAGIECLLEDPRLYVIPVYVFVKDKERLIRVLNREEEPNCLEICRRFQTDYKDFMDISFDYRTIFNNGAAIDGDKSKQDAVKLILTLFG